jgi:hypothetical protein
LVLNYFSGSFFFHVSSFFYDFLSSYPIFILSFIPLCILRIGKFCALQTPVCGVLVSLFLLCCFHCVYYSLFLHVLLSLHFHK